MLPARPRPLTPCCLLEPLQMRGGSRPLHPWSHVPGRHWRGASIAREPWLHFATPTQGKARQGSGLSSSQPPSVSLPSTFSTHTVPLSWLECKRPPSLSAEVAGASPQAQAGPQGWHRRLISQAVADTSKFISYFHLWLLSRSPPPCQVKGASSNFS